MKISICNSYGTKYEITNIEYTQFNGRDTLIEYQYEDNCLSIVFEGWLDLGQIIERLSQIID